MDKRVWSNSEFNEIKERINKEILRRGTFKWNDPLCQPTVGHDKSSPREIPYDEHHRYITDKSYTINNPSNGAIIETRNIDYPLEGDSLGDDVNSSAALVNLDEIKNYLIGLSKIKDIKLFYGRDEEEGTAFRDPIGIEDIILSAEQDILNQDTTKDGKIDSLSGEKINYEIEDGKYVMPSGESDGEEMLSDILDENNFFDDYGAEPGDGNFHPYNPAISKIVERNWIEQGVSRNKGRGPEVIKNIYGGTKSSNYGPNPRNPQPGKPFKGRPVKEGVPGTCQNMCSGICSLSCDNECSEACTSTCFGRCGNACTSTCGNLCTGCSGQCYSSCKSKCENTAGYSCLKAGAKTVKIYSTGGKNGEPAKNHLEASYYSCTGCSYSCQFYPNKKTSCWDAGCMGKCFTSCTNSCSTSCFGGCIDNASENSGDYKTGKGRGCSAGCTINCIGNCEGTCEGQCIHTCFRTCQESCMDNCMYKCSTNCGSGCESSCVNGCKDECSGKNSSKNCNAGCSSMCQNDCNANCVNVGCKNQCGIGNSSSCDSNCRLSCMSSSCTSLCSDACSSACTSCVNGCDLNCGMCTSNCSTGCTQQCNITCSAICENSCSSNCVTSCTEECSGCSSLCYSCVGMCVSQCSFKCENGCTSCANQCSYWCDINCSNECFGNCSTLCLNTCNGTCSTSLTSNSSMTSYQYKDRKEEQKAFKIYEKIPPYLIPEIPEKEYPININFNEDNKLVITSIKDLKWVIYSTTNIAGIFIIDEKTGEISINEEFIESDLNKINEIYYTENLSIFVIRFLKNDNIEINEHTLGIKLPWGFEIMGPIKYNEDTLIIIKRIKAKIRKELKGKDE